MTHDEIIRTAKEELRQEQFRKAVEQEKQKLREGRKSFWQTAWDAVFPYRITITHK